MIIKDKVIATIIAFLGVLICVLTFWLSGHLFIAYKASRQVKTVQENPRTTKPQETPKVEETPTVNPFDEAMLKSQKRQETLSSHSTALTRLGDDHRGYWLSTLNPFEESIRDLTGKTNHTFHVAKGTPITLLGECCNGFLKVRILSGSKARMEGWITASYVK